MICFPPCETCSGLCKETGQVSPVKSTPRHPYPNRNLVRLRCGCPPQIPFPLLHVLGESIDKVLCDEHGWQPLAPEPKTRKRKPASYEGMIPF